MSVAQKVNNKCESMTSTDEGGKNYKTHNLMHFLKRLKNSKIWNQCMFIWHSITLGIMCLSKLTSTLGKDPKIFNSYHKARWKMMFKN